MKANSIQTHSNGAVSVTGPIAVSIYRATVIASALRMYARTGMQANRAYTPAAMMRAAKEITGKKLKARDYIGAADALKAWADQQAAKMNGPARIIYAARPDSMRHSEPAPIVAITIGESGYSPIHSTQTPEELNGPSVTADIIQSAIMGSMFGWNAPAARAALNWAKDTKG